MTQYFSTYTEILEVKNEFYKPRDMRRNLDMIMNAILNQKAMAMDSGYVDDVKCL